jgi:hypothetical protein
MPPPKTDPVAAPFAPTPAPDAPAVDPRDAELASLRAQLAAAQAEALAAMERATSPAAAVVGAETRRPYVFHASVQFNGKTYGPGEPYPFDPKNPPGDVSGIFIEGVDYVYR